MRKRLAPIVLALAATALGPFVACSFPDVAFVDELGVPAGGLDARGDGPEAGFFDAATDGPMVVVIEDAGAKIDAAGCTLCDCDQDGYQHAGCDGGGKKLDCDDSDTRAYPDQDKFRGDPAVDPTNGDWNCDETVTFAYPANFTSAGCSGSALTGCSGGGFVGNPKCGELADFLTCRAANALAPCTAVLDGRRKQGCL